MSIFSKILVPFDGSEASKRALATAVDIVADGGIITLIQAADLPVAADPTVAVAERMAGVSPDEERTEQEVEQYWSNVEGSLLETGCQALNVAGKNAKIEVVALCGNPVMVITDYANDHTNNVDIIVMGRRGLGAVRAMLGSVSQRVAHETDLPLLLVK